MSLFDSLSISGSGVDAMQTWIDTAAGNIANADDATPTSQGTYAEQTAVFSPLGASVNGDSGDGVAVAVSSGSNAGEIEYDPDSPLADAKGEVRMPTVDFGDQLVQLIQAQDGYQANTDAMSKAVAAYQAGLTIGS
jgi:flagellar basal-body rod protein FlgC